MVAGGGVCVWGGGGGAGGSNQGVRRSKGLKEILLFFVFVFGGLFLFAL